MQGLGSILRYENHPRVQRRMISILMTMKFCMGLYGAVRCKSHSFYKRSQYGIHIQTIAIYTRGTTGFLSPTQGNNKLGRDLTASLPPVPPANPACLPVVGNTCRLYVFKPFEPRSDSQTQVVLEEAVSTPSGILNSDNC